MIVILCFPLDDLCAILKFCWIRSGRFTHETLCLNFKGGARWLKIVWRLRHSSWYCGEEDEWKWNNSMMDWLCRDIISRVHTRYEYPFHRLVHPVLFRCNHSAWYPFFSLDWLCYINLHGLWNGYLQSWERVCHKNCWECLTANRNQWIHSIKASESPLRLQNEWIYRKCTTIKAVMEVVPIYSLVNWLGVIQWNEPFTRRGHFPAERASVSRCPVHWTMTSPCVLH